ncbi:hypothetical protein F383_31803 [Gossypium arboreum]|uniref:Uncharacterized protein n=1 Tax=Gossypium arboreum TaxID=29729 RepID=A0A0B0MV27_GOSAR|nr:hypothetical protein F383_31803 [Gossypium arboreum]
MSQVTWPNTISSLLQLQANTFGQIHNDTYNKMTKSLYMPYYQNV